MLSEEKGQKDERKKLVWPKDPKGDMFGEWTDGKKPDHVTVSDNGRIIEYGMPSHEELQRRIEKNRLLYPPPDEKKSRLEIRAEALEAARGIEEAEQKHDHLAAQNATVALEVEVRKHSFPNATAEIIYRFDKGQSVSYIAQAMDKLYQTVYNTLKRSNRI